MEGVDIAVLVPTRTFRMPTRDNLAPQHALEMCKVYNNWAPEFTQADTQRFKFWGWLPRQAPDLAAEEARRCVEELGAVGVAMAAVAVDGHLLSDAVYEPLWVAVNHLRVPLGLHVPGGSDLKSDEIRLRYEGHPGTELPRVTFSGLYPAMSSITELVFGGVLERFSDVRPVVMEVGASWLLWLLWRMDARWGEFGPFLDQELSMNPSEYFRRQCYVTIDPDEQGLKYLVDYGLAGNLLISTDFPHADCPFPDGINEFLDQEISPDAKRKILWDNGAALFGIDGDAQ